ncbi:hypothetical protein LNO55_01975 [Klebsiella pneumoniae subsp. pneumoniae]|nr:hypothetical protein [Klebsiella pneumoniae subsp. pneumoniae]
MLIQKKRIRNIDNYITAFDGRDVFIAHALPGQQKGESIGFTANQSLGEEVLPRIVGAVTRFNANGKSVPDKTLPKETAYRQVSWTWKNGLAGAKLRRSLKRGKSSISVTREFSLHLPASN